MSITSHLDGCHSDPDAKRAIVRDALGIGVASGAYALSFGAISTAAGLTLFQTVALSVLMFTGASQFAMVGVIGAGGSVWAGGSSGCRCRPPRHANTSTRRLPTRSDGAGLLRVLHCFRACSCTKTICEAVRRLST